MRRRSFPFRGRCHAQHDGWGFLGRHPARPLRGHPPLKGRDCARRSALMTRDLKLDEALGLNCAWYADILMTLTQG